MLTVVTALILLAIAGVAVLVSTFIRGSRDDDQFVSRTVHFYRRDDDDDRG